MAIAKTELKKNDADDASTGGSKDTFTGGEGTSLIADEGTSLTADEGTSLTADEGTSLTADEGTSLTADEGYPVNSLSKMYGLYSNIKGFAFDMPEGWDDRNISIFLECCKESIEDFEIDSGNNDNTVWHKIAQSGAVKSGEDKSGNGTCFTVNSCIELAQCLKDYVIRNKKNVDNKAFKILYDDIIDLLQYFPDPAKNTNKNVRHRSRSKSAEKKETYSRNSPSGEAEPSAASPQKDPQPQPASTHQIENLIIKYCLQNIHLFGRPRTPIRSVWKIIKDDIYNTTGMDVDVKKVLERIKRKIKEELKKEGDKKIRAKKFMILAHDYIKFFDYMPPKTIKKKDFLGVDDIYLKDDRDTDSNFASKTESIVSNVNATTDIEYVHKKRRFSKTILNDVTSSETVSLASPENPSGLMKEDDQPKTRTESGASSDEAYSSDVLKSNSSKSGEGTHSYRAQDKNSATPAEDDSNVNSTPSAPPGNTEKFQFPNGLSDQIADNHSTKDSDSKTVTSSVLSDLNVASTTWVKEVSPPDMSASDVHSKTSEMERTSISGNINDQVRIEEDPEAVFFETKYTLRGVTDNVKCYKPRPRKPRKPRGKNTEKFEKRIMPQRSVRRKTKSYKVSDEETSLSPIMPNTQYCASPKVMPSPELRGFGAESSSSPASPPQLSPAMKVKRPYNRKTKLVYSGKEMSDERISSRGDPVPRIPKKRTYQPVDSHPVIPAYMNYRRNKTADQLSGNQSQDSTEDEAQYLERVYGLRRKQNVDSEDESGSSKRNPGVAGQVFKANSRPQIECYAGRRPADLHKFVSGIQGEVGSRQGAMSKGGPNSSPANTYCADSDSGSAEAYRPSSGSSGHLHGSLASAKSAATLNSIQEQVNLLDADATSSLSVIEKYKNRIGAESSQQLKAAMTQLVASSPSVINKTSTVCKPVHHPSTSHTNGLDVISAPPEWFRKFCNDYKKHNMWKWSQLMKMHQDMNGLESKKVEVLEKILEILERDKS